MSETEKLADRIQRLAQDRMPEHVAIIMDGNGRWATQRALSRSDGHIAGAKTVDRIIRFARQELRLSCLTLFAFSTENWDRDPEEVDALMRLLQQQMVEKLPELLNAGIRLRVAGDLSRLPDNVREAVEAALAATQTGKALQLTIALNYGGRDEIVRACRTLASRAQRGELSPSAIDEAALSMSLDTSEVPDPDLIIRTSGESRLSNFLLWQAAYAELSFTRTLWPDFTPEEFVGILEEYQSRNRRFGGTQERGDS